MLPVTPGEYVTLSVWMRKSGAQTSLRLRLRCSDGTNWIATETSTTSILTSSWQRASVTLQIPAGATYLSAYGVNQTTSDAVGDVWQASGLLVEKSSVLSEYFDGVTTPDSDLTPSWSGTADASPSTLSGVQVSGATVTQSGVNVAIYSFTRRALRVMTTAPGSSNSWVAPGGDNGGLRLGMLPGRTYTALATVTLLQAQSGSGFTSPRQLRALRDGYVGLGAGASAPNLPGSYPLRITFTVPTDATSVFIRLYNGSGQGAGDVYWDELAIVEGVYTGPYLDGDMPNCVWRGTPHASRSVGYPPSA
jgi:hypothetical protein